MTSVFEKKGALIRSVYDRFGMEPPQLGSGMDGIIAGANMGGSRSAKLSLGECCSESRLC